MDSVVDPKTSTVTIQLAMNMLQMLMLECCSTAMNSWVEDYPHVGGTKRQSMDWSTTADESSTSRELE